VSAPGGDAVLLGWTGLVAGLAGLAAYILIALRQPELVRMLNGAGLLLTSLALTQARTLIAATRGADAFVGEAVIALLILAVIAQAAAGLRNRRAWDGQDRRRPQVWDGGDRRNGRLEGEERA
jgi:hypothetical protein